MNKPTFWHTPNCVLWLCVVFNLNLSTRCNYTSFRLSVLWKGSFWIGVNTHDVRITHRFWNAYTNDHFNPRCLRERQFQPKEKYYSSFLSAQYARPCLPLKRRYFWNSIVFHFCHFYLCASACSPLFAISEYLYYIVRCNLFIALFSLMIGMAAFF